MKHLCYTHVLATFAVIFLSATSVNAQNFAKADSVINASISEGIIPGAVLCMVHDCKPIYLKAYGNRQIAPVKGQPEDMKLPIAMTEDVIFDMASCTKVVCTTTAVMQLYEQGLIDLDAAISRYLPDFEGQDITVTDLLTHTGGLPGEAWRKYVDYNIYETYGSAAPDSLVKFFAKECPKEPRGTRFEYSCPNFFLLTRIVEKTSGERFCDYVKKNIFEPLGMNDSYFFIVGEPVAEEIYRRIAPERRSKYIGVVDDALARNISKGNTGNAGLFTTASDMVPFCSMIMNGGKYNGVRILKARTIKKMVKVVDPRFGRALGWDVASANSRMKGHSFSPETIVHGGFVGTLLVIDIKNKDAVILLSNRSHPDNRHYAQWLDKREEICTWLGEKK